MARRQRGTSVVEFMIWLMLVGIVMASVMAWYVTVQREQAALETSRMLDNMVTGIRDMWKGKERYAVSRGILIYIYGMEETDFISREYGYFSVGISNALGGTIGESFRITAPIIPVASVCQEVVRFSVVNLKPMRILRSNVEVMPAGSEMTPNEVAALACATPATGRLQWDFM